LDLFYQDGIIKNNRNKKKLYEIKDQKGGGRYAFLGFQEKSRKEEVMNRFCTGTKAILVQIRDKLLIQKGKYLYQSLYQLCTKKIFGTKYFGTKKSGFGTRIGT